MRNHIQKESNVLFAMGDQRLSKEALRDLLEKFEQHEEKVVGEGAQEKLHALLGKLEERYHC